MMTTEEQIIAVAEWQGWRWWSYHDLNDQEFHFLHGPNYTDKMGKIQEGKVIKRPADWVNFVRDAPAYDKDVNIIRDVIVEKLRPEVANKWADELARSTSFGANPHWTHWYHLANASAKDRLEALCRTLWPERWKE